MRTLERTALVLIFMLAGCGQQLVEFGNSVPAGGANSPPEVQSTDPGDTSTEVVVAKEITATFTKAMDPATVNITTFLLNQGGAPIAGTVTYAGTSARFVPTSLLDTNKLYDATITIAAKDPGGLAIAADYKWSFTTVARPTNPNPPLITSVNPANGAINVCPNTKVTATFNGPMDPTTIVAAKFTLAAAASVNGAVSYDALTHTATFAPASDLATSTSFTATVTTGVKNDTGNALAANKVWRFTTGSTPCQAPINLRSLGTFVAVAGAGLTNSNSAGVTTLGGDVGLSPTGTCMSDGIICDPAASKPLITGTLYQNDPAGKAAQAKADLVLAYNDGCATGAGVCPGPGRPPGTIEADLSGLVLAPGVYTSGSTMTIATNGTAVLDGQGNSNAVWIFQIASSLTAGVGSNVVLTNGAKAANVFWIIGASSTIGGGASFKGTVLARTSNTVGTAAVVEGRLVCTDGAISLLSDTITLPAP